MVKTKTRKRNNNASRVKAIPPVYPYGSFQYIPKSRYISGKVRNLDFQNADHRNYVEALSKLEQLILEDYRTTPENDEYYHLKDVYLREHEALFRELKPDIYALDQQEKAKLKERAKRNLPVIDGKPYRRDYLRLIQARVDAYRDWWKDKGGVA